MNFIRFCYIITCSGTYDNCLKNKIINYSESESENSENSDSDSDSEKKTDINNYDSGAIILSGNIYTECAICYEIVLLKDIKAIYPCGHRLYCGNCIKNIKDNCPACRRKIEAFYNIYENTSELVEDYKNKM